MERERLLALTSVIVSAHVSANSVDRVYLPVLVRDVYGALAGLGSAPAREIVKPAPAVAIKASTASADHILSMIDGKPYKSLKRHLARHGYTPESYRAAFGLPSSYPMVSETYSLARRELAHRVGLGRRRHPPARDRGRKG